MGVRRGWLPPPRPHPLKLYSLAPTSHPIRSPPLLLYDTMHQVSQPFSKTIANHGIIEVKGRTHSGKVDTMTQTQSLHGHIREVYNDQPVFVQTSIIEKLDKTIRGINQVHSYDKSIMVTGSLIVVVYTSGTVELRSTHDNSMETFAPTHRGSGYTTATIVMDRLPASFGQDKFLGYIPTKDEWIIATKFMGGAYGWTKYFMSLDSLSDHLLEHHNGMRDSLMTEALHHIKEVA